MGKEKIPYHLELVARSSFDVFTGDTIEWYELHEVYTNWRGKLVDKQAVAGYHPLGFRLDAEGDLKWAKKVAKHYGLKVPKAKS